MIMLIKPEQIVILLENERNKKYYYSLPYNQVQEWDLYSFYIVLCIISWSTLLSIYLYNSISSFSYSLCLPFYIDILVKIKIWFNSLFREYQNDSLYHQYI